MNLPEHPSLKASWFRWNLASSPWLHHNRQHLLFPGLTAGARTSVHIAHTCCSSAWQADLSPSHMPGLIAFVLQTSASVLRPCSSPWLALLRLQSESDAVHSDSTALCPRSTDWNVYLDWFALWNFNIFKKRDCFSFHVPSALSAIVWYHTRHSKTIFVEWVKKK